MNYIDHKKIGGTAACVIASQNHFGKTPYDLWEELTHRKPPEDLTWKLPVQIGIITEEVNADFFQHKSHKNLDRSPDVVSTIFEHKEYDYLVCQPDGFVIDGNDKFLWEAKHCNARATLEEQVNKYYPQLQHNMFVTNTKKAFISCIFDNNRIEYEEIPFDQEFIDQMIPRYKDFWRCIVLNNPPEEGRPINIEIILGTELDMSSSNEFIDAEETILETREAAAKYKKAEKRIKELSPKDIAKTLGRNLEVRRDKAGKARIYDRKTM
jgi:predicted phage-related endonuclease